MPNFFKKLTGSLQMPEDEVLEEEQDETTETSNRPSQASEEIGHDMNLEEELRNEIPTEEDVEGEQNEIGANEKGVAENAQEEGIPNVDDDSDDSEEDEETIDDEEEPAGEGSPYTIAQLAKASSKISTRKAKPSSSTFAKLKSLSSKKERTEENSPMEPEGQLAIDVYETNDEIIIKSTIAGVNPEDLDVGIEDSAVNIRGSRHNEEQIKGADYFYQECYWGTFSRSVILPVEVDSDKAQASLKNGVLTIRIPKIKKEKEKKIKVLG